jgi:uncharacterized membrane protein YfcA
MFLNLSIGLGISIFLAAFIAEYFDSSLGMGYGTTLTPVLLFMGYTPMQIVPAILLSEMITGILAGFAHHFFGNADFKIKTSPGNSISTGKFREALRPASMVAGLRRILSRHLKITLLIASCSIIGTTAAVIIAINLPPIVMKVYIGILILVMGIFVLLTRKKTYQFSWKKLAAMGTLAAFNKGMSGGGYGPIVTGMSGGGYGPIVTGGQLLSGVESKSAIAITSLAEGLTCLVGVVIYILLTTSIDWILAPFLVAGAVLSVPISAYTVKLIKTKRLQLIIGIMMLALGIASIARIVINA